MVLPLVPTLDEFTNLGTPPSYEEVQAITMRMVNGKSPAPSGVTLDAFRAMVWCKAVTNKEALSTHTQFLCDYVTTPTMMGVIRALHSLQFFFIVISILWYLVCLSAFIDTVLVSSNQIYQ